MKKSMLFAFPLLLSAFVAQADVKTDIRTATRAAKSFGGSTYRSDVRDKAVTAMKAYEQYASATNCFNELGDLGAAAMEAAYSSYDLAFARSFAEKMAADASAAQWARSQAVKYLAYGDADRGDYAAAEKRIAAFLATPGLSAPVWTSTWALKARMKFLQGDSDGQRQVLEEGFKAIPNVRNRAAYERYLQEHYAASLTAQKAFEYFVSLGRRRDAMRLYDKGRLGDLVQASDLARKMLTDADSSFDNRLYGWEWLYNRECAFADAHSPLRAGDKLKCTNAVVKALAYKLTRAQIYSLEGSTSPIAYYGNRTQVIRTWKDYVKLLDATSAHPNADAAQHAVMAYAGEGDKAGAIAVARRALENPELSAEQRYELALMAEMLPLKGTPEEIAAELAGIEPRLAGDLDAKKRLERFDRAGSAATMSLDNDLVHGVARYRAKVSPELPTKFYRVRYSERPVAGAADWANLPFKPESSPFDRKYGGGGEAFLATDVATGDRGEAVKGGDGKTTLEVVADAWGLHIMRTFHDKRARDFERGFIDAGSFEEYIAPGDNQPYTCLLVYPKKDAQAGGFNTSYDGEGRRRIDTKNTAFFRSDVFFTDDAILVYTGIAWNNFPTLVPVDGATWEFESNFWGPNECSWNGLKTIHGRSSWGRLVFEMPEKARLKILENQICRAVSAYKREKIARHGWEGILTHWVDAEVGDPAFNDACVKPLEDELDAVAARVNEKMTDADVKDIAENYLEKFVDFRFIIDRKRGEYLRKGL